MNFDTAYTLHRLFTGNRVYVYPNMIGSETNPDAIHIRIESGLEIFCQPDNTSVFNVNSDKLSGSALDMLNLLGPVKITKKQPRTFELPSGAILTRSTKIKVKSDGKWLAENTFSPEKYDETKKRLHKRTRVLRKTLQGKLRLLGPTMFEAEKSKYAHNVLDCEKVDLLIKIINGQTDLTTMKKYYHIFTEASPRLAQRFGKVTDYRARNPAHRGYMGGTIYGEKPENWDPKKIVDHILSRVQHHKKAILEAYDDHPTTRSLEESES